MRTNRNHNPQQQPGREPQPEREREQELEIPLEEPVEPEEEVAEAGPQPEPPKSEAEELADKMAELQDRHLRLMAEYDNYRRRTGKEKDDIYGNATANVLTKLLPVYDNFERARGFSCGTEEFARGFALIEKSFGELLSSFGIEQFGDVGEPFDPALHHAVMHIEDESLGENVISQVLQKGFKMGERVLRYAMVQTAN